MLGLSLGLRVGPGYTFREGGVHLGNSGVHASSAFLYSVQGLEPDRIKWSLAFMDKSVPQV